MATTKKNKYFGSKAGDQEIWRLTILKRFDEC
jgi:hypothetical protein